ncbi:MAG TPA: substrate-binding domain-containing protein [Bacillus sp. (in: firmicutes)]|nr:substrate-binding domain-containing protein [Bacillus sp. (in: firmicutes)]
MKRRGIIILIPLFFFVAFISLTVWLLKEEDKKSRVIVVLPQLDTEYWRLLESGAKTAFNDFNIDGKVIVIAPGSLDSTINQSNILEQVLNQNPDALITASAELSASVPALNTFKQKSIPVFFASTDMESEYQTSYIGTNNITLGKTAGELLASMLQPGDQAAIIHPSLYDPVMINRRDGAKKVLQNAGIKIVTESIDNEQFGHPEIIIENTLQTYPNIKGIFATTDQIALEALKVTDEKKLKIPVIGADGLTAMIKTIKAGKVDATVAQNPYDIGYLSVEQAQKALKGERTEERIDTEIDIITKDNATEQMDFIEENTTG